MTAGRVTAVCPARRGPAGGRRVTTPADQRTPSHLSGPSPGPRSRGSTSRRSSASVGIDEDQVIAVQTRLFHLYDANKDGILNLREFVDLQIAICDALGAHVDEEVASSRFHNADGNQDHKVDLVEFLADCAAMRAALHESSEHWAKTMRWLCDQAEAKDGELAIRASGSCASPSRIRAALALVGCYNTAAERLTAEEKAAQEYGIALAVGARQESLGRWAEDASQYVEWEGPGCHAKPILCVQIQDAVTQEVRWEVLSQQPKFTDDRGHLYTAGLDMGEIWDEVVQDTHTIQAGQLREKGIQIVTQMYDWEVALHEHHGWEKQAVDAVRRGRASDLQIALRHVPQGMDPLSLAVVVQKRRKQQGGTTSQWFFGHLVLRAYDGCTETERFVAVECAVGDHLEDIVRRRGGESVSKLLEVLGIKA